MKPRLRTSIIEILQFVLVLLLSLIVSGGADIIVQGVAVQAATPTAVTLTSAATPGAAEAGVTFVSVVGSSFPSGTIGPNDVTVALVPASSGPAMTATVESVTTLFGSSRRVTFKIYPINQVASPMSYLVSISGATEQGAAFASTNKSSLTINPPASIASLSPPSGTVGQSLSVVITGQFSNFFQGATTASFGPGISVGGGTAGTMGPVTVNSATSATSHLVISAGAKPGAQNVTVQTGAEIVSLKGGFTITVPQVFVPNVVGDTQAAATTAITGAGLVLGTVTTASSGTVPAGDVISQSPVAGTSVAAGSAVNIVVSTGPAKVSVPNVVGLTQAAATTSITGAGLVLGTVTTASSSTVAAGDVISQSPVAGTSVAAGSAVNIVVSTGPAKVSVPNVVGLTQAAATTSITGAGLVLGTVTTAPSSTVAAGDVISQSPVAGTSVAAGSAVNIVVSTGPAKVSVPNVVGNTQAAATTAITGAGLVLGTVTAASSSTVAAGDVISQSPVAGTSVAAGSAVNIVVSTGPAPVSVPNVVGLTQAAATTSITGAGLVLGTVTTASSGTVPSGDVISQSPTAGTSVNVGSAVNIVVSTGPAPVSVPNVVGLTQAAATTSITGAGLVLGTVTTASSSTVPSGSVISQSPTAGTSVAVGSAVNIVVSTGPAKVSVPNVVGNTQAAATTAITGAGLVLGTVTTAPSSTVPSGSVITQSPVAGTSVAAGSAVNLVVSSGPTLPAPTISINSPAPGSQITQPSDVLATITDNSQGGPTMTWTVDLLRINTTGGIRLGSGTGSVADQKVGTIDPTLIANDTYALIITVNQGGQTTTAQFSYDVTSANLKLGNFEVTFADISTQIAGVKLTLLREFNSLDVSQGDFGAGWRLVLPGRVSDSAPPGAAFTTSTRAYVTRPDGLSEGFTFNSVPQPFPFFGNNPVFIPDPGVTDTLIPPSATIFCGSNGCNDFLGNPYHPTNFVLQTKDNFQYTIDELAGLQQIQDPSGNTVTVTATGLTSSTGVSVPFTRDAQGRITSIQGPGAGPNPPKVSYAYDADGNLVSFFDQLNNQTQYFYENTNFPHYLTKVQDPLGRAFVRNVFDSDGRLIASCNANGNVTTLAGCTTFSEDPASLTQTVISPRGFREDFFLDSQGNVLRDRHYLDTTNFVDTVRTYDANNKMLTETDPAGNTSSYTYDSNGNVLTVTKPGNRTTTLTYINCNQVATATDPAGHVTTYTFDSKCNLVSKADPLGNTTTYQYNTLGEVTSMTDAVGNQWSWTYDPTGLLTTHTDPFGSVTAYQYDASGYLLSKTDRNGRRIDYQYDAAHHETQETWNTTPPRVTTYSYDVAGEPTGGSSPDYSTTLAYDLLGRLITEDNQGTPGATHIVLNYSYDADGNITTLQDSLGGSTQYTYDPLTRVSQIVQSGTGVSAKRVDLLYDPSNVVTEVRRFADTAGASPVARTLFQYDCGGCPDRITGIQHLRTSDGAMLDNLTYALDAAGNVTSSTDAEGAHQYTYDADRQLLTATHAQTKLQPNEFYTYDAVGNRLTSYRSPTYVLSYMNGGKGSRLLSDAQFTYVYDAEGNLTKRTSKIDGSVTNFTWDYLNRITAMLQTSATGTQIASESYVYDIAGRRIRVTRPQGVEQYFYFGLNPVLVLDGSGIVLSRNLYGRGMDELYAQEQAGQTRWKLFDRVHSVRDTISNTAVVLNHFVYDSFGDLMAHSSPVAATENLFTSREFSTSPLVGYFRARYYSPDVGRFLSEDPINPFNYTYVGNNPSTLTDPLGLTLVEDTVIQDTVVTGPSGLRAVALEGETLVFHTFLRAEAALLREQIGAWVAAGFGGTALVSQLTLQLIDLEQFAEGLFWEVGLPPWSSLP